MILCDKCKLYPRQGCSISNPFWYCAACVATGAAASATAAAARAAAAAARADNSTVKGTGQRFNAGKTPYEYLPLAMLLDFLKREAKYDAGATAANSANILRALASWQMRDIEIDQAIHQAVGVPISLAAFAPAAEVFKHVTERPVKPYPTWNWASGMKWSIPYGCAIRHSLAENSGQINDPETNLPHRGHTLCNLIMLLQYSKTYLEGDDRPPKGLL